MYICIYIFFKAIEVKKNVSELLIIIVIINTPRKYIRTFNVNNYYVRKLNKQINVAYVTCPI